MARTKVSTTLLLIVSMISMASGVGITLVAEDLAGIAYRPEVFEKFDPTRWKLNPKDYEAILNFALDHPDLGNAIMDWFEEQILNGNMNLDELANLLKDNPEMSETLTEAIVERFKNGEYTYEDLQDIITKYPELAFAAAAALASSKLEETKKPEAPEPEFEADGMGPTSPSLDDGTFDPEENKRTLFRASTNRSGSFYLRSTSFGDYNPETNSFDPAPEFDGSTYFISPLAFSSFAAENAHLTSYRMNFEMDGYRDYGMIAPDTMGTTYTVGNENKRISENSDSRAKRIDAERYSVDFYPDGVSLDCNVPTYLYKPSDRYMGYAKANYMAVPASLQDNLDALIREEHLTGPRAIVEYFQKRYTYEIHGFTPTSPSTAMAEFLDHPVGSTCSNFAAAMTLLCRAAGYPARFVTGFRPAFEANQETSITTADAHAWCEVYFARTGWVRYDATPTGERSLNEANENGDSCNGIVDNGTWDPSSTLNQAPIMKVKTDYTGTVYLRSASFGAYNEEEHRFEVFDDGIEDLEMKESESSLNFGHTSSAPYHMAISVNAGSSPFYDKGMIFPDGVALAGYHRNYDFGNTDYDHPLRCYDDSRYFREAYANYSFAFDPQGPNAFYGNSVEVGYVAKIANLYPADEIHNSALSSALDALLSEIGLSGNNDADAERIASFVRDYADVAKKTLAVSSGADTLYEFISQRTGTSSDFAALATILLRRANIPARYVEGYKIDVTGSVEKTVKRADRYSWVEVYFNNHGWQRYDVTRPERPASTPLKISAHDVASVYNGTEQSPDLSGVRYDESVLYEGDSVIITSHARSRLTDVGSIRLVLSVQVLDNRGRDVTSKYKIDKPTVYFSITPAPIKIASNTFEVARGSTVAESLRKAWISEGELYAGASLHVDWANVDTTSHGVTKNAFTARILRDGTDVSQNYEISYELGNITFRV